MAIFTVDNIIDEQDGNYTTGNFSLREAIATAGAGDTIVFDATLSGLSVKLLLGDLILSQDVTIDGDTDGDNKHDITIEGGDNGGPVDPDRIFDITGATTDVTIKSLHLIRGDTNNALTTLGAGGAIQITDGSLTVKDTSFESNDARYGGGAIHAVGASLTVVNTLFHNNNSTQGNGGAINIVSASTATVVNSIITGGSARYALGGGVSIDSTSSLSLYNSTVVENRASFDFSLPTPPTPPLPLSSFQEVGLITKARSISSTA